MWHEARRREKTTQKLLNEHKKRAEKRREENRVDPISLLQVHGIKAKLHIDANTFKQAEKSLVVWQGDKNVTIDRFDVRATLTSIPTDAEAIVARKRCKSLPDELKRTTILDIDESDSMKKLLTYERYRLLMQNDLNQVPEQTRLKMVVKSEYLTDAHMKKLQNNRFGTSGESNYATTSQSSLNNPSGTSSNRASKLLNSRDQQNAGKGSSLAGYSCNQVPPPASLHTSNDQLDDPDESTNQVTMDLDDNENYELDGIDEQSSTRNPKRANEVTMRYGLTSDEFSLLARKDQFELQTLEIIRELKKLVESNQKKDQASELAKNPAGIYGPCLPPEMIAPHAVKTRSPVSHYSNSSGSSPVRQRSPSGGIILLRNGSDTCHGSPVRNKPMLSSRADRLATDDSAKPGANGSLMEPRDRRERRPSLTTRLTQTSLRPARRDLVAQHSSTTRSSRDLPTSVDTAPHHQRDQVRLTPRARSPLSVSPPPGRPRKRSISGSGDEIDGEHREEVAERTRKRAETPLAYKRHCRSSRSLSRERRWYSHQTNDNHRGSDRNHTSRSSGRRYDEYRGESLDHRRRDRGRRGTSRQQSYSRSLTRSRSRSRSGSYSATSPSSFSSSSRLGTRSRSASYSSFYSNKSSSHRRKSSVSQTERRRRTSRLQAVQQVPRRRPKKRRTGRKRRRRGGRRRRR